MSKYKKTETVGSIGHLINEATEEIKFKSMEFDVHFGKFYKTYKTFSDETEAMAQHVKALKKKKGVQANDLEEFYNCLNVCRHIIFKLQKPMNILKERKEKIELAKQDAEIAAKEALIVKMADEIKKLKAQLHKK